jgi:plasmid stabilization system protein ParE
MPHALKLLRLHPEAAAELQDSINFYRERGGEQLAQRFKLHIEAGFRGIIENPEMFSPVRDLLEVTRYNHF